jgi:hypothetical protein
MAAEQFANDDGLWYRYVFSGVVHLYYHVNAHCAIPVAQPHETFFLSFLY